MSGVLETRIVIVEDHTLVRDLLQDVIATLSTLKVVASAGTVADGIDACAIHRPDLVIADWMLLDGTGLELIRNVRTKYPETKVLMLTANDQEGIVRDAAKMGVHGFVSKRQTIPVLREAILTVASGSCYYCPISSRILIEAMKKEPAPENAPLTPKEWVVLRALASGLSTKEISEKLDLSPKTVGNHISALKEKLHIHEPAGLVLYAIKHGLVNI